MEDVVISANGFVWVDGKLEQLLSWPEFEAARSALDGEVAAE